MDDNRLVLVRISGRVQGVWFRDWTKRKAVSLGLSGWVRNCSDGSVEALLSGPVGPVDEMIAKCRRGSPLSRVDEVRLTEQEPADTSVAEGFEIRTTNIA